MILVLGVWAFVRAVLVNSAAVSLENVVLRHQLAVLQRSVGRPRLRRRDRLFWVGSHSCGPAGGPASSWSSPRPSSPGTAKASSSTGVGSPGGSAGRPPLDLEIRTLIRRMARANPTWGRRRIQAELRFLGFEVAGLTVAKYMRRPSPRPSSPWRTFLASVGLLAALLVRSGRSRAARSARWHQCGQAIPSDVPIRFLTGTGPA